MSIKKSKRRLLNVITKPVAALNALLIVFAFAANSSAQGVSAQVPVIVTNIAANVKIDPPAAGQGTGAERNVTANNQQTLNITLLEQTSVLHQPQIRTTAPASVSHSRGNVTLNLHAQQYQNAVISLYSVNGKRILNSKVSASNTTNSISRSNIPAGVYMLKVLGINGNSFSTKLTHSGEKLNINAAFEGLSVSSNRSANEANYGMWTITVSAQGYTTQTRTFQPVAGANPLQSFTLNLGIVPLSDTTDITLNRTTAEFTGRNPNAVIVKQDNNHGTIVEIDTSGIFRIQGTLDNGFVAVSRRDLRVTIILNGVNITSRNYAPIVSLKRSDITLVLAANTTNTLTDGGQNASDGRYNSNYDPEERPNATLMVRRDLTIRGAGRLIVNAGLNNGIGTRAYLTIESGDVTVNNAPNNAIKGNDGITITGGTFNITSRQDAIKTEEDPSDPGRGAIDITGGDFTIVADQDGIQAATSLTIANAAMKITTGVSGSGNNIRRGSNATARNKNNEPSSKGLKSGKNLIIKSGTFDIDSRDDAIHADDDLTIDGGTITVATNDAMGSGGNIWGGGGSSPNGGDGLKARRRLTINNGDISVTKSYEGIEAYFITINGGKVRVVASDDGINASDSISNNCPSNFMCCLIWGRITINGGEVYVTAGNDGLDSNGDILITGGTTVLFGPANSVQEAIDLDGDFHITGGTVIAVGADQSCMQKGPAATTGSQRSVFIKRQNNAPIAANTIVNMTSNGQQVAAFRNLNAATRILVSSPLITNGQFVVSTGGNHSGTQNDMRVFNGGSYSGGTQLVSFNVSNIITENGSCQGMNITCRPR